ncbi:MAG: DUF5519 family protein [Planctomycetes bacterium]|nr:DUF5519 family protein [Planctomycetota bacterium]
MARRSGSPSSAPDALEQALRDRVLEALPDVSEAPSRFGGGLAFRRGAREFAHFHPGGEVDLRLPRAAQRALRDDPRAVPRPRASDWIAYRLEAPADVDRALELIHAAWEAAGG